MANCLSSVDIPDVAGQCAMQSTASRLLSHPQGKTLARGSPSAARDDPARFIRDHMRVVPAPFVPEIRLYMSHPGSGLRELAEFGSGAPPYWAYHWAGGTVLARYFLDRPGTVRGRRVLDLGAGSGIVAIAAAMAGAGHVIAAEIDSHGLAAIALNAALNNVADRNTGPGYPG